MSETKPKRIVVMTGATSGLGACAVNTTLSVSLSTEARSADKPNEYFRLHINLRAETAGFSRAEEARGGAGSLSTLDLRAAVSGFLLLKTPNCGTLVLVGDCPDRAEGTIRALHPWTRFERVTN